MGDFRNPPMPPSTLLLKGLRATTVQRKQQEQIQRERVRECLAAGCTKREIYEAAGISRATLDRWIATPR